MGIDSTTLNKRWIGHLASDTVIDAHNWMYPLAYGFIFSEMENNWTWFMNHLKKAIGDLSLLAVCMDVCKGSENEVKNVFPNVDQREHFFHASYEGENFLEVWKDVSCSKSILGRGVHRTNDIYF